MDKRQLETFYFPGPNGERCHYHDPALRYQLVAQRNYGLTLMPIMVLAEREGKTQTRRLLRPERSQSWLTLETLVKCPRVVQLTDQYGRVWATPLTAPLHDNTTGHLVEPGGEELVRILCPYGPAGSHLWVKETYRGTRQLGGSWVREKTHYRATEPGVAGPWVGGRFMPRELSRTTLETTQLRIERACDISEADAVAEGALYYANEVLCRTSRGMDKWCIHEAAIRRERGLPQVGQTTALGAWRALWHDMHGYTSWRNWVWVLDYKRIPQDEASFYNSNIQTIQNVKGVLSNV